MKYCIITADDFGMSRGINRGILEAHGRGVVTSTSMMVNMPTSAEAAALSRAVPTLNVGLHVNFTGEGGPRSWKSQIPPPAGPSCIVSSNASAR